MELLVVSLAMQQVLLYETSQQEEDGLLWHFINSINSNDFTRPLFQSVTLSNTLIYACIPAKTKLFPLATCLWTILR